MRRFLFSLFLMVVLICSVLRLTPANAQERKATITGRATDTNHDPLVGAKVELQPLGQTAVTDAQGGFKIADLAPGDYTMTISYVGFTPFTKKITVASGGTANVDAELQIETVSEQVIVRGERERGEIEALNREETSDNIVQVLPAEVITSLPNTNIADAVGRMPSVSLERDEGEGKYVQIRGTEPRLTNVTVDGVHLPSPEAVRNVKLDAIPADLVDSVEINKTLSANQEGDAIGGSVNLVTKKATDQPYITVLGMGGHTRIEGGRNLDQFTGTIGKRFGKEKRFGIMFGGSYDWNARGSDDVEPAPGTTLAPGDFASGVPVFFGEDVRQFWYDRTRFGFATSADYKLGTGSFLYLRGLFSQFNDGGQDWIYTPNISNYTSATTAAPTNMVFNHVFRNPFQQIFNGTVGAQHTFGPNLIGYEVSGGQARYSGGFPRAVFGSPGGIIFGLDTSNPHNPKFNVLSAPFSIFDPTQYALSQVQYNSRPISEQDFTGNVWLTHQYNIGTHYGTFETGFKVRDAQKNQVDTEFFFNCTSCATMNQFLQSYVNPDYYFGAYQAGPTTDWSKINSFFLANQGLFTSDPNLRHHRSDSNNFSLSERVYAGYVMNTITIGHFRLQTGLRFEATQGSFLGTQANFDSGGTFLFDSRVPGEQSYVDVLPSVQLQYNINGSTNIRAAYGRGIARPNFGDLPPFANLDQGGIGGTTRVFTGNPKLTPSHANDYDLLFEHYLKTVGIIQVGWFYKDITDPIYTVQTTPTTGPFAGFKVTQKINGPGGHIQGVEMSWQQHLRSLPGLLGGIGVSANYSYTTSQASFPVGFGRTDHPALLRQAPNNWNFDVTYDKGPISARMGLTHNDANIFAYNFSDGAPGGIKGPNGDVYFYPHTQVDAQVMYHLPRAHDFQVVASFLNLNNEVFGFYQGSEPYSIQREYYNRTYSFGLRWTPSLGRK
jgi:TonB-dependent receptor